jgi:hypothetical protein
MLEKELERAETEQRKHTQSFQSCQSVLFINQALASTMYRQFMEVRKGHPKRAIHTSIPQKYTPSPGVGANEIQQEGNSNGNKTNRRPVPLPRKSTSPLGD